jgi:hypothetical protein
VQRETKYHFDNVIFKQKPGPKVIERLEGAAFTPKNKQYKKTLNFLN